MIRVKLKEAQFLIYMSEDLNSMSDSFSILVLLIRLNDMCQDGSLKWVLATSFAVSQNSEQQWTKDFENFAVDENWFSSMKAKMWEHTKYGIQWEYKIYKNAFELVYNI